MKKLLQTASELSSNGLAMVDGFSSILSSLQIAGFSRKLLGDKESEKNRFFYLYDPNDPNFQNGYSNKKGDHEKKIIYLNDPTYYDPNYPNFQNGSSNKKGEHEKNSILYQNDHKQNKSPPFVTPKARKVLEAKRASLTPNVVVAQDGSSKFRRICDALALVPKKNNKPFVIFVKAGVYREYVIIPKRFNNIVLVGEGPTKTIITGDKNYADGAHTFHTATVAVNGEDFIAKDIAFENTSSPGKHQAVGLRVSGDRAIFLNVHMNGFQDTLYTHVYRQYYRDCHLRHHRLCLRRYCGDLPTLSLCRPKTIEKPGMHGHRTRTQRAPGVGVIVIQNSDIVAEPEFTVVKPALQAYLGRPWMEFSRTIIMPSVIDSFIDPEGWSPWTGTYALDTLYYGEYQNRGLGSNMAIGLDGRVSRELRIKSLKVSPVEDSFRATHGLELQEFPMPQASSKFKCHHFHIYVSKIFD